MKSVAAIKTIFQRFFASLGSDKARFTDYGKGMQFTEHPPEWRLGANRGPMCRLLLNGYGTTLLRVSRTIPLGETPMCA